MIYACCASMCSFVTSVLTISLLMKCNLVVCRGIQFRWRMELPGECYETPAEFPCTSIDSWPDAIIHVI